MISNDRRGYGSNRRLTLEPYAFSPKLRQALFSRAGSPEVEGLSR